MEKINYASLAGSLEGILLSLEMRIRFNGIMLSDSEFARIKEMIAEDIKRVKEEATSLS